MGISSELIDLRLRRLLVELAQVRAGLAQVERVNADNRARLNRGLIHLLPDTSTDSQ